VPGSPRSTIENLARQSKAFEAVFLPEASLTGAGEPGAAQLSDCDAAFAPKEEDLGIQDAGRLIGIREIPDCDEHDDHDDQGDHVSPLPVFLPKAARRRSSLLKLASLPHGAGTQKSASVPALLMRCDQSAQEKLLRTLGDVSIWFDVGTPGWSVAHVTGCATLLLGHRAARPGDLELTSWVHKKEREHFIEWAQEAYCQIWEGTGPTSQVYQRRLRIRPPALKHKRLAYKVTVALSSPLASSVAMLDVLNVRLVEK
jgi:uncharacterized protein YijF (DUF1287 family)